MPTYLEPALSLDDDVITDETLEYFRRYFYGAVYDFVMRAFHRLEDADLMTKARLADRINKDRARITKWLAAPSNMRLGTLSDLLVGMAIDPTSLLEDELPAMPAVDTASRLPAQNPTVPPRGPVQAPAAPSPLGAGMPRVSVDVQHARSAPAFYDLHP